MKYRIIMGLVVVAAVIVSAMLWGGADVPSSADAPPQSSDVYKSLKIQ